MLWLKVIGTSAILFAVIFQYILILVYKRRLEEAFDVILNYDKRANEAVMKFNDSAYKYNSTNARVTSLLQEALREINGNKDSSNQGILDTVHT